MIFFVLPFKHRGDVARALMYMAVCYGFRQPDGGPVLHLSDSPKICKLDKKATTWVCIRNHMLSSIFAKDSSFKASNIRQRIPHPSEKFWVFPCSQNQHLWIKKRKSASVITTLDLLGLVASTPSPRYFILHAWSRHNRFESFVRLLLSSICDIQGLMFFWQIALLPYPFIVQQTTIHYEPVDLKTIRISQLPSH